MTNVYVCIAERLLLIPNMHFHLLMDWLTCVIIVQLKEFRQAVEDCHTHLHQNPYYPPTTQSSRSNSKCSKCHFIWNSFRRHAFECTYIRTYMYVVHLLHACAYLRTFLHEPMRQRSLCAVKYVS